MLFNGFKPLFEALSPADVNQLSYEIVTVFQGEGGTLESLLANTASLTAELASRDQVIGSLITNLNRVMVTIGNRDEQLSDLLGKLRQFVSGLSRTGRRSSARWTRSRPSPCRPPTCVTDARPPLTEDIKELRKVARNLDNGKAEIDRALQVLPVKLTQGRTHGDLRLLLQLLPLQLQGVGEAAGGLGTGDRRRRRRGVQDRECEVRPR